MIGPVMTALERARRDCHDAWERFQTDQTTVNRQTWLDADALVRRLEGQRQPPDSSR